MDDNGKKVRVLFGAGWFRNKSLRGAIFAGSALVPMFVIAGMVGVVWLILFVNCPLTTSDLTLLLLSGGLWWLLDDRLIPASEILLRWGEEPAQLENFKEGDIRMLGLAHYSATCPIAPPRLNCGMVIRRTSPSENFCWITQLTDSGPDAFAKLDVELNGSNPIFVEIHELPRGSPSFRPHPRGAGAPAQSRVLSGRAVERVGRGHGATAWA